MPGELLFSISDEVLCQYASEHAPSTAFRYSEQGELDEAVLRQYLGSSSPKPVATVLLLASGSSYLWFDPKEHGRTTVKLCTLLRDHGCTLRFVVCPTNKTAQERWDRTAAADYPEIFKNFLPANPNGMKAWPRFNPSCEARPSRDVVNLCKAPDPSAQSRQAQSAAAKGAAPLPGWHGTTTLAALVLAASALLFGGFLALRWQSARLTEVQSESALLREQIGMAFAEIKQLKEQHLTEVEQLKTQHLNDVEQLRTQHALALAEIQTLKDLSAVLEKRHAEVAMENTQLKDFDEGLTRRVAQVAEKNKQLEASVEWSTSLAKQVGEKFAQLNASMSWIAGKWEAALWLFQTSPAAKAQGGEEGATDERSPKAGDPQEASAAA